MRVIRRFLGQRLRAFREERGWSQRELGRRSGLTGKFIGQVERSEMSISVDSLSRVSRALEVPLDLLTDLPPDGQALPSAEADRLLALLAEKGSAELRRAYMVVKVMCRTPPR
jgi:XRE family transcriptional regulator, regulator of sulfur utilization